jgi:hypothetical protein
VLGAPRLHCTIATGEVVSKDAAGEYALATFDPEWHPIIKEGLAYQRREPVPDPAPRRQRIGRTAAFVSEVVRAANALP